jgi:DNA-binding NarL/FixJ family response regulator
MGIRILLADDHEIMREGLCALLRKDSEMEVLGQADNGRIAVEMARKLSPDVVIMDVGMPNLNGIDATRQMRSEQPEIKVLALSMHSGRSTIAKMLKAGATGYMLKESAFTELLNGIRAVCGNQTYLCPQVSKIVLNDYVNMLSDPNRSSGEHLTPREREVLQLVAEGKTTKEIASSLHIEIKTVDAHRGHIMDKLKIHNVAGLTKYAIRESLTFL